MTDLDIARKIVAKRTRDSLFRAYTKATDKYDSNPATIPQNIPKIADMTDSQIDALKQASLEFLGIILNVESDIRDDIKRLEKEYINRNP